ncbi:MAG: hypothetical protein FWH26_08270 [Oscillospiraceae bacterium]|nr:hypothetical protein [Oscillospiraceae bacterium]
MHHFFYNGEHYPDPTAYEALLNIMREERRRAPRIYRDPVKPREVPGQKAVKEAFENANIIPS